MLLTPLPVELGGPLPEDRVRVAVTASLEPIVTTHDFGPEQPAPDQPANAEPDLVVGASVTCAPWPTTIEHVSGHETPAGPLVTDPEPAPATETVTAHHAVTAAAPACS